jgi:hypothetical protein
MLQSVIADQDSKSDDLADNDETPPSHLTLGRRSKR